jgi:FkbM family methyltransferase
MIRGPCETADLPYLARNFDAAPDLGHAAALLSELADTQATAGAVALDRPLALYGAGNLGRLARDYLKVVRHDVVAAIDRDADRLGKDPQWSGVRLLTPETAPDAVKRRTRLAVSVVTAPYVPLAATLATHGFADVVPFYDIAESFRHLHPLSNGWFAAPFAASDRDNIAAVLTRWDDDTSRAHHLQFLAWRRLRQEWSFAGAPVAGGDRFFISEVRRVLHDHEVFVDAGAHHGEVSEAFARLVGSFRAIIAVEPDPMSLTQLVDVLKTRFGDGAQATVYDCALSEEEGEALFHDGLDYASQLSPTGRMRVMRRRLDTLDLAPTFLKMHLEGAELPALKGARETLLAHRPIIAATVYHNADGLWCTAAWLMETLPRYRFLFRAHSWCGTGAVIYAIPQERGGA